MSKKAKSVQPGASPKPTTISANGRDKSSAKDSSQIYDGKTQKAKGDEPKARPESSSLRVAEVTVSSKRAEELFGDSDKASVANAKGGSGDEPSAPSSAAPEPIVDVLVVEERNGTNEDDAMECDEVMEIPPTPANVTAANKILSKTLSASLPATTTNSR